MTPEQRVNEIQNRLQKAFSPTHLEIQDDAHKHHGHASNQGAGYYTLRISAESLKGKSRVEAHRAIYSVLNDLIPHEIHALVIQIV